jgi:hypothetical protein
MRKTIVTAALMAVAALASAQSNCFGTGIYRTCSDASGNSYSTSRIGNSSFTNGYNSQNGTTWNQNSHRIGNTTMINGRASNGASWNQTIIDSGSTRTIMGTDSRGQSFSKTCTASGCF